MLRNFLKMKAAPMLGLFGGGPFGFGNPDGPGGPFDFDGNGFTDGLEEFQGISSIARSAGLHDEEERRNGDFDFNDDDDDDDF